MSMSRHLSMPQVCVCVVLGIVERAGLVGGGGWCVLWGVGVGVLGGGGVGGGGFVFVAARYVHPLAREEGVLLDGGAATPL